MIPTIFQNVFTTLVVSTFLLSMMPTVSAYPYFVERCPSGWTQIGDYCYSTGAMAGIVIGALIGAALLISAIVFGSMYCCCRHRLKSFNRKGVLPLRSNGN